MSGGYDRLDGGRPKAVYDPEPVMQARVVSTKPDGTLRILDMGFRVLKGEEVEVGNE